MMKTYEADASSHNRIGSATMKPAATCNWNPRQHLLILMEAVYRLAATALLPPLAYVTSVLECELDRVIQEFDTNLYNAIKKAGEDPQQSEKNTGQSV